MAKWSRILRTAACLLFALVAVHWALGRSLHTDEATGGIYRISEESSPVGHHDESVARVFHRCLNGGISHDDKRAFAFVSPKRALTPEQLATVESVIFIDEVVEGGRDNPIRDSDVEQIRGALSVRNVVLGGPGITNSIGEVLASLPRLETVSVHMCADDDVLAQLASIPTLVEIRIDQCPITDNGVAKLLGLRRLRVLRVNNCPIIGAMCWSSSTGSRLRELDLSGTLVGDRIGRCFSDLTNLEVLDLSDTEVTDEILTHIESLSELRVLDIDGTRVTDEGIETFRRNNVDVIVQRL